MYYYIVNPAAGNSAISGIQDKLKTSLHRLNIDGEFAKTIGEGDAAKIAAQALRKGLKTIVAVGGDETVNEVITAVHNAHKPAAAIGIIPIGKQNLLANHLGIRDWQQACQVLSARRLQEFSLMSLNEHVFIYSCSIERRPSLTQPVEPAPTTSFDFIVDMAGRYKLRGQTSRIEIHNQKFLNPALDNDLVIRIQPAQAQQSRLAKLMSLFKRRQPEATAAFSQLHGNHTRIEARQLAEAAIDGRPVEGKRFEVALTDWQVRLITNLGQTVEPTAPSQG